MSVFIILIVAVTSFWLWNRARPLSWEWPYYVVPGLIFFLLLLSFMAGPGLTWPAVWMAALLTAPYMIYEKPSWYVYHSGIAIVMALITEA